MDGVTETRMATLEAAVDRFLRAHPDWLAARPDLYRALTPPSRVHGEAMADHLTAMVQRERLHAHAMMLETQAVLAAGRHAAATLAAVHEAVLTVLAAPDPAECLLTEVPRLLRAEAACLALSRGPMRALAQALEQALGGAEVRPRVAPAETDVLYAEAASLVAHDVLIRLPGLGVLAFGFRERGGAETGAAAGDLRRHLAFLGRAASSVLRRAAVAP